MLRTLLIVAGIWLLAASPCRLPAQGPGNRIAVVVGISRYPDVEGIPGLRFADRDASRFEAYLRSERGGRFDRIIVLLEEKATRKAILAAARQAVTTAGPNGQVFLFFSARGRATPAAPEGAIFTWESREEKNSKNVKEPNDSAMTLSELQQALKINGGPRIFLFADLCRTPAEWQAQENRINFRVEDLARSLPRFSGLLASEGAQRSYEDPDLERGHGAFSYFMVEGLSTRAASIDANGDKRIDVGELSGYLRRELPAHPQYNKQRPRLIGVREDKLTLADLQYPVARIAFSRAPGLLAFAGPLQETPLQVTAETQAAFDKALQAHMTTPQGGEELLERLRTLLQPADWELERDRLEAAYEGLAQEIFLRYGTGDRFPDDSKWRGLEMTAADFTRAEQWFRAALRLHPQDASLEARALFCAGRAATLAGVRATGRMMFQQAIDRYPSLAEPHNALGVILLEASDYTGAAEAFRAAHNYAPRWAFPLHNLALTDIETGDFRGARREYETAIKGTPYYPYLYYNLAVLYHRLSRFGQAERMYRKSIQVFIDQATAYETRAQQWAALGNTAEETRAAAFADVLRRNEAEAHNGLAVLYGSLGRRDRAIQEYQAALSANPSLLSAAHNLALLNRDDGNFTEALRLLQQNVTSDPAYLPSQLAIAATHLTQGSYPEAERHYREALAIQPRQVDAQHGIALALAGQDRVAEAIVEEKKIIELQTQQQGLAGGRFHESLGDLYGRSGDSVNACSQYRIARQAARSGADGPSRLLARKIKACQ